jgi:hypothetical protein
MKSWYRQRWRKLFVEGRVANISLYHSYNNIIDESQRSMNTKIFTFKFFTEIALHFLVPNPFYDQFITFYVDNKNGKNHTVVNYLLSDFLIAFMHIRVFYIVKAMVA